MGLSARGAVTIGDSSHRRRAVRCASTKHAEARENETGAAQPEEAPLPFELPPPEAAGVGVGTEAPGWRSSSSMVCCCETSCWARSAAVSAGEATRAQARAIVASSVWKLLSSVAGVFGRYARNSPIVRSCCSKGGAPLSTVESVDSGRRTRANRSRSTSARASLLPSKKRPRSRTSRSESGWSAGHRTRDGGHGRLRKKSTTADPRAKRGAGRPLVGLVVSSARVSQAARNSPSIGGSGARGSVVRNRSVARVPQKPAMSANGASVSRGHRIVARARLESQRRCVSSPAAWTTSKRG